MAERRYRHTCQNGGWCGLCEFLIDQAEDRRRYGNVDSDAELARWEQGPGWNNLDGRVDG